MLLSLNIVNAGCEKWRFEAIREDGNQRYRDSETQEMTQAPDSRFRADSTASFPDADALTLHCAHCDYCLIGLTEDRCPECGKPFDRHRLTRWATGKHLPLTFGRRSSPRSPWRWIAWNSLFAPARLARELPPHPRYREALWYGMVMRLAAVLPALLIITGMRIHLGGALGMMDGPVLTGDIIVLLARSLPASVLPIMLGSLCCELALSALIQLTTKPRDVPAEYYNRETFWLTLCHCFSTYLPLSVTALGIGMVLAAFDFILATTLLPGIVLIWWWVALAGAVRARTLPSWERGLALLGSIIVILSCFFLGAIALGFTIQDIPI